jgi:hypothetical protein
LIQILTSLEVLVMPFPRKSTISIIALGLSYTLSIAPAQAQAANPVGDVLKTAVDITQIVGQFQQLVTSFEQYFAGIGDFISQGVTESLSGITDAYLGNSSGLPAVISEAISAADGDPLQARLNLQKVTIDPNVRFNPFNSNPASDAQFFASQFDADYTRFYANSSVGKQGQDRFKKSIQLVSDAVGSTEKASTEAQGLDVTQDVMKKMADEMKQQALLAGVSAASLMKIDQSQNVGNSNLADINEHLNIQNTREQTESSNTTNHLLRATRQSDLY